MDNVEKYLVLFRACFIGGYTLPQYCIDNGIKKPLFVAEEKFLQFMWEIHVQFRYDKRILARFSVLDLKRGKIDIAVMGTVRPMKYKNFSKVNRNDFDAIIALTTKPIDTADNVISLSKLAKDFLIKVYVEIPTLNFLQRYPQVKLILTNFPRMERYKDGLKFNRELVSLEDLRKILRNDKSGTVKTSFDKFGYTNEEVLKLIEGTKTKTNLDGSTTMEDNDDPLINIKDNKRGTACQPENYLNKIYIVGTCHQYGLDVPYDKTIASYLQKMLNEHKLPYRVENESQRYARRYQDIFYNLNGSVK